MYRGKDRSKKLTDMDEEAETKAIEKWLRMVDEYNVPYNLQYIIAVFRLKYKNYSKN